MIKQTARYMLPALCAAALCLGSSLTASAYTPDDVAAKARAAGWPENVIQAGYNEWASGEYTQAQLDKVYASVTQYDAQTAEMISEALDIEAPPPSAAPASDTPTDPQTEAPSDPAPETPAQNDGVPAPQQTIPEPAAVIVTKADGSTEERISKADFIQMSMEEKKNYVASLSEESKKTFMDTLSTAERNSILKQLPADEKAALIQKYVDTAKDMGLNVAVDTIADNNVSMTIRNNEGQIVGKTGVGIIIDETGISHTAQLMTAFLAALTAVFGFAMIYRYLSRLD